MTCFCWFGCLIDRCIWELCSSGLLWSVVTRKSAVLMYFVAVAWYNVGCVCSAMWSAKCKHAFLGNFLKACVTCGIWCCEDNCKFQMCWLNSYIFTDLFFIGDYRSWYKSSHWCFNHKCMFHSVIDHAQVATVKLCPSLQELEKETWQLQNIYK